MNREQFQKAMAFYQNSPTAQYDVEACHALDNFFDMLECLERIQKAQPDADQELAEVIFYAREFPTS